MQAGRTCPIRVTGKIGAADSGIAPIRNEAVEPILIPVVEACAARLEENDIRTNGK
jgi:hypothetical protein